MAERIFDVTIIYEKVVRVRVPDDLAGEEETAEDVAEEFALGGKEAWPQYVIWSNDDYDVQSVYEVAPPDGGREEEASNAAPHEHEEGDRT